MERLQTLPRPGAFAIVRQCSSRKAPSAPAGVAQQAQLEGAAADVFGPGGSNGVTQPAVGRVLSWRVSITMEAAFCVETLEEALAKHAKPRSSTSTGLAHGRRFSPAC